MKKNILEKEFFNFIYKRQLIWHKRFILKEKAPWTDDEVLKKYKIINMYRELDRCTLYILNKLKGIRNRETILLNIIFYRFFNIDQLYEKLGIGIFEKSDLKDLIEKFDELKKEGPVFSNAYLISGVKGERKHVSVVENLGKLDIKSVIAEIDKASTPESSFGALLKIPMVGPFLACEIWTDLAYLGFFKQGWNDNDFVNIGPGAKWGLEIIYGKLSRKELMEKLKHLHTIQGQFFDNEFWKKIAYKEAFSNYPFLSITNIEGALCEFRKYCRLKNGKGKKRYFKATG
jgi:hypothetical protein